MRSATKGSSRNLRIMAFFSQKTVLNQLTSTLIQRKNTGRIVSYPRSPFQRISSILQRTLTRSRRLTTALIQMPWKSVELSGMPFKVTTSKNMRNSMMATWRDIKDRWITWTKTGSSWWMTAQRALITRPNSKREPRNLLTKLLERAPKNRRKMSDPYYLLLSIGLFHALRSVWITASTSIFVFGLLCVLKNYKFNLFCNYQFYTLNCFFWSLPTIDQR